MPAVLRQWFARWGLPAALRVDNGPPWGSWGDLPPELALWVRGLGVAMVWHRPRQSRDNAVIERDHGVCQCWVEPHTCAAPAALPARLDWATTVQREKYPAIAGQSRVAAYPALAAGGRPYDAAQEAAPWDAPRVWTALAQGSWHRRVDKVGRISLYNRPRSVGRRCAGTTVSVRLGERTPPTWVITTAKGEPIRELPAPELCRARIRTLTVTHRRPRR